MKALGMIETYGRVGSIEGLDAALKGAQVTLVNMCGNGSAGRKLQACSRCV